MKWFKHDSGAHTDAKLKKVRHKYGIIGYGLYWYCIELIAGTVDKDNISFSLEEDAELIAMEWSLDQLKVQEMMEFMIKLGLFEESNGSITCLKLAKRLDDTNAKNPQIRAIVSKLSGSVGDKDKVRESRDLSETLGEARSSSEKLGDNMEKSGKTRLEEIRLEENNIKRVRKPAKRFAPPSLEDCINYSSNANQSELFVNYYESNGWKVGRNKMVNLKASLTNWIKRAKVYESNNSRINSSDLVGEESWT